MGSIKDVFTGQKEPDKANYEDPFASQMRSYIMSGLDTYFDKLGISRPQAGYYMEQAPTPGNPQGLSDEMLSYDQDKKNKEQMATQNGGKPSEAMQAVGNAFKPIQSQTNWEDSVIRGEQPIGAVSMGEAAKFDFKNVAKALAEKEENTSTKKADDSSDLANAAKYGLAAALVARDKELPMPTSKPLAEMSSEEREKEKDRFRFYMDHFGPKNFK